MLDLDDVVVVDFAGLAGDVDGPPVLVHGEDVVGRGRVHDGLRELPEGGQLHEEAVLVAVPAEGRLRQPLEGAPPVLRHHRPPELRVVLAVVSLQLVSGKGK